MLFTNSAPFRSSIRTSITPNTPCDNFCDLILSICFFIILPINILSIGIRYNTRVDPRLYYEPCNITTDLIPILYLHSLHHQKDGYDRILQKDTSNNGSGGKRIPEIERAREQKAAILEQIKVQTEFRQKCAGINIRSNQTNIIEKAQFWAIWLFRIGSVLTLIYGWILYKYLPIIKKYPWINIIPFDPIFSCFICSGISLSDYYFFKNFDETKINFEVCFFCF